MAGSLTQIYVLAARTVLFGGRQLLRRCFAQHERVVAK
jgi:hypothetical protein